jgi:hypothetical protein
VTAPAWLRSAHPALQSRTEALGVLVAGLSTLVPWAQRLLADEEAAQPAAEDEATQQTARGCNVGLCRVAETSCQVFLLSDGLDEASRAELAWATFGAWPLSTAACTRSR